MADHPAVPARVRLVRYAGRVGGRPSTWPALPLMTLNRSCGGASGCQEQLLAPYSITSSAVADSATGMVMPSALAVCRLMASST
jgi:hypothetical protein